MISDAIILMLFGMGVVFVFLVLLNLAISLLAYFTREHTLKEEASMAEEARARREKKRGSPHIKDDKMPVAIISAAVHAYRSA